MKHAVTLLFVALALSSCGNKGKIKSPSQIAYEQEKKEKRAAKQANSDEASAKNQPASPAVEAPTPAAPEKLPATPSNELAN